MRVVIDTVVFVRALINPHGPSGQLLSRTGEFTLCTSEELALELMEALQDPALRAKFTRAGSPPLPLRRILDWLAHAEVIEVTTRVNVCRDPDDNKVFACALDARASAIVSEDKDVLSVQEYQGIRTTNALGLLSLLDDATS